MGSQQIDRQEWCQFDDACPQTAEGTLEIREPATDESEDDGTTDDDKCNQRDDGCGETTGKQSTGTAEQNSLRHTGQEKHHHQDYDKEYNGKMQAQPLPVVQVRQGENGVNTTLRDGTISHRQEQYPQ